MKIISFQNVQSYQKIIKNGKNKYVLMKKVILHAKTAKITVNKIYMPLSHVCLALTNVQVKIWWQFAIDQLEFGFWSNMTHDTRSFIFYSRFIRRYGKHVEVVYRHYFTAKQKGQVQVKMCDDNRKLFIATLHNVLFPPDLCNRIFSIIAVMKSGHTCLFHKGFCTVYFVAK